MAASTLRFLFLRTLFRNKRCHSRNHTSGRLLWFVKYHCHNRRVRLRLYQLRKKILMMTFIASFHRSLLRERSLWTKDRNDHWWQYIVNKTFSASDWSENFRMRQESFNKLCGMLKPHIEKSDTQFRKCISVELRVAVTLWTLATNVEYRTIGHLFGISRASVCNIVKEVCAAIHNTLLLQYIYLPVGPELLQIMHQFEITWGFPNCAGAIDGCHIPIIAPRENHTDYYNRKGFYSVLLQAAVDCNYLIRDTCIGWPGKVHDARVLANSEIYRLGQSGKLFPKEIRKIQDTNVPVVILGDPAYPLLTWLMKPYAETARTTPAQYRFNYTLSRNRMVVENAFGRLKGRWRRLLKRLDFNVESVPMIISACCVLHNFCESEGDTFRDEWRLSNCAGDQEIYQEASVSACDRETTTAGNIREAFCRHFSANV